MTNRVYDTARRVRAVAVLAVVLCGFIMLAPLTGRTPAAHHQRIHVVKIVSTAVADQPSTTLRLDHPGATPQHGQPLTGGRAIAGVTTEVDSLEATTLDSVRTRGPPTTAR